MNIKRFLLMSATALLVAGTALPAHAVTLYSVRSKDTLARIAQEHHVSIASLLKANAELRKHETVRPGQILMIPDADEAVDASDSNKVVIHTYQIINPTPRKTLDIKPVVAKDKPVVVASKPIEAPKPVTSAPVTVAVPAQAAIPVADTQVIVEADEAHPTSDDVAVTHVPNQDNIAIIDSQIIHVPTYVKPADPVPDTTAADSSASAHAAHPIQLASRKGNLIASIITAARHFMGVPYVWGGTTPSGFDCSGFVQRAFAMNGVHIPRLADAQYYQGTPVKDPSPGDLVFFSTYLPGPSHVGIYLGGNQFIHASSHKGVTVSSLSDPFYAKAYIGSRRYF